LARPWPVIQVLAGGRPIAVPMFAVSQAVSEDTLNSDPPLMRSLAQCLGEPPVPSQGGRTALLLLRRRGPPLALHVEALLGHSNELVYPVGPVLQFAPWILGVIEDKQGGPPVLVIDPLALPGLLADQESASATKIAP
jgi:hypothetical protein